jgi:hypothetical protein
MMRVLALFLVLFAVVPVAHAETYRCKGADGAVRFQDTACPTGSSGGEFKAKAAEQVPRGATASEFGWVKSVSEKKVQTSEEKNGEGCWAMPAAERAKLVGASADELKKTCGAPSVVNRHVYASGEQEQWVYRQPNKPIFYYLVGGRVRSIQD